jgi:carbon monoxide dehydrogenase subunit G
MKLEGTYRFEASPELVWEVFTDPRHLKKAIPGCERMEEYEPHKYDALLKISIAAVKGSYDSKFEMVDLAPPRQYRLIAEGSGRPGFVKGYSVIKMTGANGGTVLNYQGELQVGGLIAGVGQRMINGIAKLMLNQFFEKMGEELKSKMGEAG